ncbi:MAG: sigma-70 family RNA polymerase sigma factor [Vulcanimicrobiaceae bacterium]
MTAFQAETQPAPPAGTRQDRERAVEAYRYLCARGARKFVRPGVERADLEQVAAIGLIKAYDRFDEKLQTPFEAFAWFFVVGELMHYVRDHERLVRPPRRLRRLERTVQDAYDGLVGDLRREPSPSEVASRAGVTEYEMMELQAYRERAVTESLQTLGPHELQPIAYTMEHREDLVLIERAIEQLTPTERTIIWAVYSRGFSHLELAKRLGYSQRHISRLHRAALRKMQPFVVHTCL